MWNNGQKWWISCFSAALSWPPNHDPGTLILTFSSACSVLLDELDAQTLRSRLHRRGAAEGAAAATLEA